MKKQDVILYQLIFLVMIQVMKRKFYSNMCLLRMILATLCKYFLVVLGMLSLLIKYLSFFLCFGYQEKDLYFIVIFLQIIIFREKIIYQKNLQIFLGFIEQISMLFANLVLVKKIVIQAFPFNNKYGKQPQVLYSAISFSKFESSPYLNRHDSTLIRNSYFISLNRYERKKNIALAIHVFAFFFRQSLNQDENIQNIRLVVARGYEQRVEENAQPLINQIRILKDKILLNILLLKKTFQILKEHGLCQMHQPQYIPEREHFGIVSLEAMYNEIPVIACNSGGPKELIQNGVTGYLCDSKINEWCQKMIEIPQNKKMNKKWENEKGKEQFNFLDLYNFK
ncbi:unnamed protein product [Paramecium pentaurelia]|uniref:Alpha-1,3/1,6-mannosyltransferase ALG2 n=1 Tax=Paramecium pentaurelia TaxID=43138 RepID=A0A8S1SES4_9CILI|nr:unnamed protein product [Paramecium pentaurelia]